MGFGQEIKDFLSAYKQGEAVETARTDREYKKAQQDALVKKTARDNDPDTLKMADDKAKLELQALRARIGSTGASTALTRARIKALEAAGAAATGAANPDSVIIPGAATGLAPETLNDPDAPPRAGDTPAQHFAEGGFVGEADEDDDPNADMEEFDAPQPAVGGGSGATDMSARSRNGGSLSGIAPQLIHDAVKGGLNYGAATMGLGQRGGIGTAAQRQKALEWQRGFGAIPQTELDAVKKAIDPEGKMTEAQRNMMALGKVYQFQMAKNNPEGAQRAAFQVLQAYRLDAQRFAAIASHAAEEGDLDTAARAAVKAYANIPDGRDIAVFKDEDGRLNYSYTDAATGKTIAKGFMTPQQLAAQATGIASGSFDKLILQAAGQRNEEATKGKGATVSSDYRGVKDKLAATAEVVGSFVEKENKKNPDKPLPDTFIKPVKQATYDIHSNNPDLTPETALSIASTIITAPNDKDGKPPYKIFRDEENEVTGLTMADGRKIKLRGDQYDQLVSLRGRQLAQPDKKEDPGFMERAGKAISDWHNDPKAVANRKAAGEVGSAVLNRAGEAIGAGVQAVRDRLPSMEQVDDTFDGYFARIRGDDPTKTRGQRRGQNAVE